MKRHTYHAVERVQPFTLNFPLAGRVNCHGKPLTQVPSLWHRIRNRLTRRNG